MTIEPRLVRLVSTTNAATAVNIDSPTVDSGDFWIFFAVSLFNESGENVTLTFNVVEGSQVMRVGGVVTVQSGDAFERQWPIILREGENLRAIVTGAALKGKVTLVASGLDIEIPAPSDGDPVPAPTYPTQKVPA